MRVALLAISLLMPVPGFAQDWYSTGDCPQSEADTYVETTGLRARILANGSLFWRGSPAVFEIPKGSGTQVMFNDNLMVGGWVDEELRASGSTYGPFEFWAGPIPDDGTAPLDCAANDRMWTLSREWDLTEGNWPGGPTENVLEWPAHLGAPYQDVDGIAGYDPLRGDRPLMRGDHMVWWVMNDRGNQHMRLGSAPLGIEVIGQAWAFNAPDVLGTTLFISHTVTNRGDETIREAYISRTSDPNGVGENKAWSTDSTLSAILYFSAENTGEADPSQSPPALGYVHLDVVHSDDDPVRESAAGIGRLLTSSIRVVGSGSRVDGEITSPEGFYNYARGLWLDGTPIREGFDGYDWNRTRPVTRYFMPGDPVTGSFWSPTNWSGVPFPSKILAGWYRSMASYGPFSLDPGESLTLTTAYVWRQGADYLDSVVKVREAIRILHENKDQLVAVKGPASREFIDGNPPETPQYPFWVDEPYPNPASDRVTLSMSLTWDAPVSITVHDMLGRERWRETFEGMKGPVTRSLDLGELPPGTYLIRVTQRGESNYQRVVKL